MKSAFRYFAAFALFGWLFAIAHVALEHGGVMDGGAAHLHADGVNDDHEDHDDDGPDHDGHHHHDLTVLTGGQFAKAAEQKAPAPVWLPLCSVLVERLAAVLRDAREPRLLAGLGHSPPDERASGWLLVCRSALPVRGPSLV